MKMNIVVSQTKRGNCEYCRDVYVSVRLYICLQAKLMLF